MSVSTSLSSPDLSPFLFSLPIVPVAVATTEPFVGTDLHTSTGGLFTSGRHHTCWEQLILDRKKQRRGGTVCLGHT